jgi:hypothetical protein
MASLDNGNPEKSICKLLKIIWTQTERKYFISFMVLDAENFSFLGETGTSRILHHKKISE